MRWEFAIAVKDEPEAHRKKEGDVVAVKPYPWSWGKKELNEYLIVIVDNLSKKEAERLCQRHYEGGVLAEDIDFKNPPKIIGKNMFSIPLDIIKDGWKPDLNLSRVRDKKDTYQPLKDKNIVLDASERVSIFKNKHTRTFKFSTKKNAS